METTKGKEYELRKIGSAEVVGTTCAESMTQAEEAFALVVHGDYEITDGTKVKRVSYE